MRSFNIAKPDEAIRPLLQDKVDNLTKPKGSLGTLEELAIKIGVIQQTLTPELREQTHIVFAADHGIVEEGVSVSPKEVTRQMVFNFLEGGAGVNFLARQHNFNLYVVDSGVDFDFSQCVDYNRIIDKKIRCSTRNYLYEAAMTHDECDRSIDAGAEVVDEVYKSGCNVICFGEMGITNTSSSAIWMSYLAHIDLKECVGAGSDYSGEITNHKYSILKRAVDNYRGDGSAEDIMRYFGGYEMVMTVGAMLRAAELGMIVLIDGFIMSACALMASALDSEFLNYAIFGHVGDETGHRMLLDAMSAHPILHLGFRLGEGTGALCAFPIIDSAVRMIGEMSSFERVNVTKYF
ncbi:MAG: nicotinate-nucleotide--dimethylbenzimidazole phosphoribosyltransferase [Rikenellaceae bacterium]